MPRLIQSAILPSAPASLAQPPLLVADALSAQDRLAQRSLVAVTADHAGQRSLREQAIIGAAVAAETFLRRHAVRDHDQKRWGVAAIAFPYLLAFFHNLQSGHPF